MNNGLGRRKIEVPIWLLKILFILGEIVSGLICLAVIPIVYFLSLINIQPTLVFLQASWVEPVALILSMIIALIVFFLADIFMDIVFVLIVVCFFELGFVPKGMSDQFDLD